ncbi:LacI family DNA-binding transcriptional regulator [Niabella drilacis]|uniref:Transcriptional regulator, LacI family n=1 Tax=Niabella drilacis (strain DSM 25811 / CCM 8410 / CCUG 62505 / LMG 26954 / E90) TaxID=1285928 RepID=A0A1G6NVU3_NIADE|nr:LacI family DNA-binding transcriptional regulator [Niabella drilacis]SDC72052.1 transcriptional regulator, LacI family [Niabella drilacis]
MSRFITIKDIARKLDISVSTVSRALRDTYDVNRETREKVLAMANALNYRPNFNATGLVNRSSHNLAVILPFVTNYYFSAVITGIQEVAYQQDYNIILHITNDSPERERAIIKNLAASNLDGLLVAISSDADACAHFQQVIDSGVPIVFFDRVPDAIKTSKVMQDDYNGAFDAVEHLIGRGYQKIAHIGGPQGLGFTRKRKKGFLDALAKHGLPVNEEWIIHSGFSREDGEADALKLLKQKKRPDAIFAANDRKAIGALMALKKSGIKIGAQMGIIGFTNDPASTIVSPTLSTIAEPAFEIGKRSCELLLKHISKRNFIPEEVILPGTLIERESTLR